MSVCKLCLAIYLRLFYSPKSMELIERTKCIYLRIKISLNCCRFHIDKQNGVVTFFDTFLHRRFCFCYCLLWFILIEFGFD